MADKQLEPEDLKVALLNFIKMREQREILLKRLAEANEQVYEILRALTGGFSPEPKVKLPICVSDGERSWFVDCDNAEDAGTETRWNIREIESSL